MLGHEEVNDIDENEREQLAERIDDLLDEWKKDFNKEIKLKSEVYTFLAKVEILRNDKLFVLPGDASTPSKTMAQSMKKQIELESALLEKEEQIQQFEQKVDIQCTEINMRKFKSEETN